MAKATWSQSNFNGGEWSPLAQGRFDLDSYRKGLSECRNFVPLQQGGLTRRPGTRFVAEVKDSSAGVRLQTLDFSTDQSYVLEFGDEYIRFYTDEGQLQSGGVAVEVTTPYKTADLWGLGFASKADALYILHTDYAPRKLLRQSAYVWTLTEVDFLDGPYLPVNATSTVLTPSDTFGEVVVTASSTIGINSDDGFRASDLGRQLRIRVSGVWLWGTISEVTSTTAVKWIVGGDATPPVLTSARGLCKIANGNIHSAIVTDGGSGYGVQPPSISFWTPPTTRATLTAATNADGEITTITVVSGGDGYSNTAPTAIKAAVGAGVEYTITYTGAWADEIGSVAVTSGGRGYPPSETALPLEVLGGGFDTDAGEAYAYASLSDGSVTALELAAVGSSFDVVPDLVFSDPEYIPVSTTAVWRLGLWNATDGYPNVGAFHQDRLVLAGATSTRGRVDASNTGDYENFAPSTNSGTVLDSNAYSFTLNGDKVDAIRWIESDEQGLLIGTFGSEWAVAPSGAKAALVPSDINAKRLSNYGSHAATPVRIGKSTMFVQRAFRKIRELFYQFTYNTFQAVDISLISEHLTVSGFKQLAVQMAPYQVIWGVRTDGALVGITYDRDQEVCGWHAHELGYAPEESAPTVESLAVIPSGDMTRDVVWLATARKINGVDFRAIEYIAKQWEDGDELEHACFLDCSAEYDGAPTTTVSGLDWWAGATVSVFADGVNHAPCLVNASGEITLQRSASVVQAGAPYTSRVKTLCIEAGGMDGTSQGKLKRIWQVTLRLFQSLGLRFGSDADGVEAYAEPFRTAEDLMDNPVPVFTGDRRRPYEGSFSLDGRLYFEVSDPVPCNITALIAKVDTQDNN